jgi:hypothetical protein
MRNKILKFRQILESKLDSDLINDVFSNIEDNLNIEFSIIEGYFSKVTNTQPDNYDLYKNKTHDTDKYCYRISIKYNSLDYIKGKEYSRYESPYIDLNSVYKLILELSKTYKFYSESYIRFVNGRSNLINVYFLVDLDEDLEEDEKVSEIYTKFLEIKTKINSLKSDFGYNTIVELKDGVIVIRTDSNDYTDRKLNLALRGIDLSNLERNKWEESEDHPGTNYKRGLTYNTFKLKYN